MGRLAHGLDASAPTTPRPATANAYPDSTSTCSIDLPPTHRVCWQDAHSPAEDAPIETPLVGAAALNAIPDGLLRSHTTALLGQSPGSRSAEAPALLAPFTTYHMLFLMREAVGNITNGNDWEGWKMQPSLGRTLAALTGAPEPDFETARLATTCVLLCTATLGTDKEIRKRLHRKSQVGAKCCTQSAAGEAVR